MEAPLEHFAVQRFRSFEHHARPDPQLLSRMHQRFPGALLETRDEQTFDRAAAWHSTTCETRRKHARIVDDQQVALLEARGQRGDR